MKKTRKTKRFINILKWSLLLPAAALGIYGGALKLGILPKQMVLGNIIVEFFELNENAVMKAVSNICFIWLPILWLFAMIIGAIVSASRAKESDGGAGGEASKPEKPRREEKKSRRKNKRAGNIGNEGIIGDGDPQPIDADGEDHRDFTNLREVEGWSKINGGQVDASVYEPISLDGVVEDFRAFSASYKMDVPEKTAREWLSAIAAGRIIAIEGGQSELGREFVGMLAKYFGGSVNPYNVKNGGANADGLLYKKDSEGVAETDFLKDIYTACLDGSKVRFAYLYNIDSGSVSLFSDYRSAFERDSGGAYLPLNFKAPINGLDYIKDGKVLLPENLILVLEPIYGSEVALFSDEVMFLSLDGIGECDKAPYYGNRVATVRSQLQKALGRARSDEKYRISDELWKKLDGIEERLGKYIKGYRFDNRRVRLMERYFVAYRALGGDEGEAIGNMLSACLFKSIYSNKRNEFLGSGDSEGLASFIEDSFGDDNVCEAIDTVNRLCGISTEEAEAEAEADEASKAEESEASEEFEKNKELNEADEAAEGDGASFTDTDYSDEDLT